MFQTLHTPPRIDYTVVLNLNLKYYLKMMLDVVAALAYLGGTFVMKSAVG